MGDSESFSSLMDLVNSHLSKTSLNASPSGDEDSSAFPLASVCIQTGTSQTVFTPPNGIMSIPRLGAQDHEINEILAHQVTNMLIAKEKRREEEEEKKKKLKKETKQLKLHKQGDDNYVIDLMSSIIIPEQRLKQPLADAQKASTSHSFESLQTAVKAVDNNKSMKELEKPKDCLPLNQDMSYMLFRKVKKGKPSAFGKIMAARVRPVAAPYMKMEIHNSLVKRFDFSTQSPCDINLEKRRHPPHDPYAHMNMVERFMAQTNNDVLQRNM